MGVSLSGLESTAFRAGGAVVKLVAGQWLAERKQRERRGLELADLISLRFGGLRGRQRNDLRRRLEELGETAGERLHELAEQEFGDLADHERVAALEAVVDTLDDADLSDATLLRTDLDPESLAQDVREQVPSTVRRAHLGEAGGALFDLALDQACRQLVHLVRELPEFDSRLAEESLRRATSELTRLNQVLERLPVTSLDAPAGTDHDERFRRRYLDLVARHHDDLELIGVSVRNFRPRTTLSVAYLSLTVNEESRRRGNTPRNMLDEQWFDRSRDESANGTMRVESALGASERTLVRGEAGFGKSTLLRWLVVTAARNGFTRELEAWNGCVPILVKLRSYADGRLPRPEQFLDEPTGPMTGPVPEGWTHRQLSSGRVLLLIDGVDELSDKQRPKVRRWLRSLLEAYPRTRVVVTSRPAAAGARWLHDEEFSSVSLENMSPPDVRVLLERWHSALLDAAENNRLPGTPAGSGGAALPWTPAEIDGYRRKLLAQLDARAHLRGLARSPLMCAMLCALHLDRGSDLPRDRTSLYHAALEMLLYRRETERDIPAGQDSELSYRDKSILLQDLAFWLITNGWSEVRRDSAVERIARKLRSMPNASCEPETALRHLITRSGVVREPVEGRVDFVHRTFQEFLAAAEAADEQSTGLLVDNAHRDQWRETVIMAAGLLSRTGRADLINGVLDRADAEPRNRRRLRLLAATCQESLHDLPPELIERIHDVVQGLLPPRSRRESSSLATVGEPLLGSLPASLERLTQPQAEACVRTAALINGPGALRLLAAYAHDPRPAVQLQLATCWELFDAEDYARTVLAHAPLNAGEVEATRLDQIPHLGNLSHLRSTRLLLLGDPHLDDLHDIDEAIRVTSLKGNALGHADVTPLSRHQMLRELVLAGATQWRGLDALGELKNLTRLMLGQREPFATLGFLRRIPRVRFLLLGDLRDITDYSPLAELGSLRDLWLSGCRRLESLEPIAHHRLATLDVEGCPNSLDLTPLAEMDSLQRVSVRDAEPGIDLAPLADTSLEIRLDEDQEVRGEDELGPGVKITRV